VDGQPQVVATLRSAPVERRLAKLKPGRKLPTVLFLHGCTGLGETALLNSLAANGYAVIAPDSMARRYRPLQCDPRNLKGGYNLFVYSFREAELIYALQRLAEQPWVDLENLFLIGSSEGGVTAALYRGDDFNARVIAQWTCAGAPLVRGIAAPEGTPILAIVRSGDPWYDDRHAIGQQGDCGRYLKDRPGSRSIVLRGSGEHGVFDDPAMTDEVIAFFERNLVR
jgi:dienelactone hydrolase